VALESFLFCFIATLRENFCYFLAQCLREFPRHRVARLSTSHVRSGMNAPLKPKSHDESFPVRASATFLLEMPFGHAKRKTLKCHRCDIIAVDAHLETVGHAYIHAINDDNTSKIIHEISLKVTFLFCHVNSKIARKR